jgi:hypothetical protein
VFCSTEIDYARIGYYLLLASAFRFKEDVDQHSNSIMVEVDEQTSIPGACN